MKMRMINQTDKVTPVTPVTPAAPAVPVDMPRDGAGNIVYECGNFFQSAAHPDGLIRPPHAHEPSSWASLLVDPDILSQPAPAWQQPGFRHGLLSRVMAGPYYKLGYHAHCHACYGYFLTLEWAQEHKCTKEQAFRDVTRREVRDYRTLRKAARLEALAPLPKKQKGILARFLGMFSGR